MNPGIFDQLNGALLINKHAGISSFGVIEALQKILVEKYGVRRRDLPKLGHGGTIDPFATGLLIVCTGKAVKLARYFLGSTKHYEGVIRFGETTVPGDPTAPVTETSEVIPESLEGLQKLAHQLCQQPYLQKPPMYSAKKKDGKPLYELAREGIEVERESKLCHLYQFDIQSYEAPRATFSVSCSSGTYIRTLSQDFARLQGSVALLEKLHRCGAGAFEVKNAWTLEQVSGALKEGKSFDQLPCWIDFDRLLDSFSKAEATEEETSALRQGRQNVLFNILRRASQPTDPSHADCIAIYHQKKLVAIARQENQIWGLERVFN